MTNITESGVVFWDSNEAPYAPVPGTEAMVKFMDRSEQMKPFVLMAEHPEGAKVKPHKHPYGRIEYILEGELEFFEGQDALAFWRGEPVKGQRHGPGSVSYVPANTLYAYLITKASKLLHVHESDPTPAARAEAAAEAAAESN